MDIWLLLQEGKDRADHPTRSTGFTYYELIIERNSSSLLIIRSGRFAIVCLTKVMQGLRAQIKSRVLRNALIRIQRKLAKVHSIRLTAFN